MRHHIGKKKKKAIKIIPKIQTMNNDHSKLQHLIVNLMDRRKA